MVSAVRSEELFRLAVEYKPTASITTQSRSAMLSAGSGSLESPHLGAAFLGEGSQRVYSVTVYKPSHLSKRLVRCKIGLDNHANDGLSRFDHGRAREDPHLAYQRVQADQCSDLRLVVREGVGIELRRLVDELLFCRLPLSCEIRLARS
jgi:hypothetical protein